MTMFQFGVHRSGARIPRKEVAQRQRIAERHECHYVYWWDEAERRAHAWFAGPNLGHPFDKALADAVLAEVNATAGWRCTREYVEVRPACHVPCYRVRDAAGRLRTPGASTPTTARAAWAEVRA